MAPETRGNFEHKMNYKFLAKNTIIICKYLKQNLLIFNKILYFPISNLRPIY